MSLGSLFQSDGAAAVKALSLNVSFVFEADEGANKSSYDMDLVIDLSIATCRPTYKNT